MKLLIESWRQYLSEEEGTTPKVIFMAGAPGVGKGYVRDKLQLINMPEFTHTDENGETKLNLIDPDEIYVPMLRTSLGDLNVPHEDQTNLAQQSQDYNEVSQKLKKLVGEIVGLSEPSTGWDHAELMNKYEDAHDFAATSRSLLYNLETIKKDYDDKRDICSAQGTCFGQAQAQAKDNQSEYMEQRKSMVIDGTAGHYPRILNQKKAFEDAGYKTAMIFVSAPLQTAIDSQKQRDRKLDPYTIEKSMVTLSGGSYLDRKTGEKVSKPNMMKPFVNRHGKKQQGYENEFAPYYFQVDNDRSRAAENIAIIKPQFERFLDDKIKEDFQQDVKKQHKKMKIRLIGGGGNKTKASPFNRNPSMKRSKSAPPGFGGS